MYSSEDFERLFIRYKGEAHRNNVPYNLFEKWYKDTRHRVVEVTVDGRPSAVEEEEPTEAVSASKKTAVKDVRILLDLRMSNGLHLRQGNLSHGDLKRLVEKLEGLC